MAQVSMNDFEKGMKVVINGDPHVIVENTFTKPGKGNPFSTTKLKNLRTGRALERTFKGTEKLDLADVTELQATFSYKSDVSYVFSDPKTYEEINIPLHMGDECEQWLMDEALYGIILYNGEPIAVNPPNFLEMKITETTPGVRGDTSGRALKDAVCETGAKVKVPLFIEEGEHVRIDTRTGDYVSRVQK